MCVIGVWPYATFIVFASSSSGKTSGQNLKVLNIINADTKTYKNIKNNQSMIKKLCAPHPEIKVEADACFETKK
jgi:hypothetical protein